MNEQQPYHSPDPFDRRDINGWPGYQVDSNGTVWTCLRQGPPYGLTDQWKRLAAHVGRDGYARVALQNRGRRLTHRVHQLVLLTFRGPRPAGAVSCHENGQRDDNRLVNLRWDTPKNNSADRRRHGTAMHGSLCPWAKLSEADVAAIRRRRAAGEMLATIASDFGIHLSMVSLIAKGKKWRGARQGVET